MVSALVGHLVGDYLLQNDWMAINKGYFKLVCAVHCAIWATCVTLFAGWPFWAWAVLFVTHFVQDHTSLVDRWMTLVRQNQFKHGACAPWSRIVVDNVWHIVVIWILWKFFLA